jgi:hypothetical protein
VVEPAPRPPSDDARVDTRPSSACGSAKIRAGCWWAAWLRQRRSGPAYGFRSRGGLASKDVAVLGPLSFVCDFNYACLPGNSWTEKSVENWRNRFRSVLSVFDKLVSESNFFKMIFF